MCLVSENKHEQGRQDKTSVSVRITHSGVGKGLWADGDGKGETSQTTVSCF